MGEQQQSGLNYDTLKKANLIQISDYIIETLPQLAFYGNNFHQFNGKYYARIEDYDFGQIIYNFFQHNAPSLYTPQKAKNIIETIKFHPSIKKVKEFDPYQNLINLNNGILNLDTFELIAHNSDYLFSTAIDVDYDPKNVDASYFIQILQGIFRTKGNDFDAGAIETILQLGGYLMYPQNKTNYIFLFYGEGSNGKSIIMEDVYQMFFDPKFISSLSFRQLCSESSFERKQLLTSRINFSAEEKGGNLDSEELKKMADGAYITINRKFEDNIVFRPKCKLVGDCNNLPGFKDKTYGTLRRLFIVKFPNKFEIDPKIYNQYEKPEKKGIYLAEDRSKVREKIKKEKTAIFNLFLKSLKILQENKWRFQRSENMRKVLEEYQEETDPAAAWLIDNWEEDTKEDNSISVNALYDNYKFWYERNHVNTRYIMSSRMLSKRVRDIFRVESYRRSFRNAQGEVTSEMVFPLKRKELTEIEKLCLSQNQENNNEILTDQERMDIATQDKMI